MNNKVTHINGKTIQEVNDEMADKIHIYFGYDLHFDIHYVHFKWATLSKCRGVTIKCEDNAENTLSPYPSRTINKKEFIAACKEMISLFENQNKEG